MRAWGVVPMKSFDRAKSRLAPVLTPTERADLAQRFFERVVTSLAATEGVEGVVVATDSEQVAAVARELGAEALLDRPGDRLAAIVDRAIETLPAGTEAALVSMADLPQACPEAYAAVLARLEDARLEGAGLVLVPDLAGAGTNALGLRPPGVLRTCFGHADSLARHLRAAEGLGLQLARLPEPRLAFDVDAPTDHGRLTRDA